MIVSLIIMEVKIVAGISKKTDSWLRSISVAIKIQLSFIQLKNSQIYKKDLLIPVTEIKSDASHRKMESDGALN